LWFKKFLPKPRAQKFSFLDMSYYNSFLEFYADFKNVNRPMITYAQQK
jgi:hypothetical protein